MTKHDAPKKPDDALDAVPKDKGGRPTFKATAKQRARVSIAAGGGMRHDDIAIALGISTPTLRKHFEHELSIGAYERRAECLEGLYALAKKGNAGAAKAYLSVSPQLSTPPADGAPVAVPDASAAGSQPGSPKGKKEQANEDAKTAHEGTDWNDLLRNPASIALQ